MPAAGALRVVGVDGAALERRDRVVHETGLVQRVGVDGHLYVLAFGDGEAAVDRRGRRAPVLVQLEPDGAGADLIEQPFGPGGVPLAGETDVQRQVVPRPPPAREIPRPRGAR